jgi:excisionase family DNA binding protein
MEIQISEKLLKAGEIAAILQVSKSQAYRLLESEIPCVRFGSATVRVRLSDFQNYIEAHIDIHSERHGEVRQAKEGSTGE